MIKRDVQNELEEAAETYPVVTITGPRQAGKTTLVRYQFSEYNYCNLENPEIRSLAENDPNAFFHTFQSPLIIDEIQRVPGLLSYIQVIVDETDQKGLFILTGSHQLELHQAVSQSLAGRVALIQLLPLSIKELAFSGIENSRESFLYHGFLPRIYKDSLNPTKAYRNYTQTYIERDLRQLINLKDLTRFENFLRLLAGRIGQVLNLNSLAGDVGASSTTLKNWLSILEASFIIFRLNPYFENFGKRVIKSPKIYFTDVGVAVYLLGIENEKQVSRDPLIGSLFENMVVLEAVKTRLNQGLYPNLYYYRDNHGNEVDLLYKKAHRIVPIEIKYSMTYSRDLLKSISYFQRLAKKASKGYLIYSGELTPPLEKTDVINFRDTYKIFK